MCDDTFTCACETVPLCGAYCHSIMQMKLVVVLISNPGIPTIGTRSPERMRVHVILCSVYTR